MIGEYVGLNCTINSNLIFSTAVEALLLLAIILGTAFAGSIILRGMNQETDFGFPILIAIFSVVSMLWFSNKILFATVVIVLVVSLFRTCKWETSLLSYFPNQLTFIAISAVGLTLFLIPNACRGLNSYSYGNFDSLNYVVEAKQLVNHGISGLSGVMSASNLGLHASWDWGAVFVLATLFKILNLPIYILENCLVTLAWISFSYSLFLIAKYLRKDSHSNRFKTIIVSFIASLGGLEIYISLNSFIGQLFGMSFLFSGIAYLLHKKSKINEIQSLAVLGIFLTATLVNYWSFAIFLIVAVIAVILKSSGELKANFKSFLTILSFGLLLSLNFQKFALLKSDSVTGIAKWHLNAPTLNELLGINSYVENKHKFLWIILTILISLSMLVMTFFLHNSKENFALLITITIIFLAFIGTGLHYGWMSYSNWKILTVLCPLIVMACFLWFINLEIFKKWFTLFVSALVLILCLLNVQLLWHRSPYKMEISHNLLAFSASYKLTSIVSANLEFKDAAQEFQALAIFPQHLLNPVGDAIYYRGEKIMNLPTIHDYDPKTNGSVDLGYGFFLEPAIN